MPKGGRDMFDSAETPPADPRPYICIMFECCSVYQRIYRRPHQRVYAGHCPRCLRPVQVRVGPEGTNARMFRAY